ncbi:aminotransferase class I/II-fold pyridoxal phosphate-dependent enzyme [bacterium]|nr:aminotransferase class I/II-fold pyridoxal phosphate-dependent enzyme [bacterium]
MMNESDRSKTDMPCGGTTPETDQLHVFDWLHESLEEREAAGLLRRPAQRSTEPGLDFASNDYLGLRHDIRLHQAGIAAAATAGAGAGSSPAVSGWTGPYQDLVEALADWKRAEAALAFSSGYAANVSIVAALVTAGDAVYADRLSHACLIDGTRASGAMLRVFAHNDPESLARALERDEGRFRRRLIVTESLFSMDGDQAPLTRIADLAGKHRCMMLVDEAHATGVFGPEGRGLVDAAGLADHPAIVRMGTLSKAIGCQGGYVVGSRRLISWLIQASRGWIYSTALAPYIAGASTCAIGLIRSADSRRSYLLQSADALRATLRSYGWEVAEGQGPIVPVRIGPVEDVMRIDEFLASHGIAAGAIRPPTVPAGTARLRISLSASHGPENLDRLVRTLNLARESI